MSKSLAALITSFLIGVSVLWHRLTFQILSIRVFTSRDLERTLSWLHGRPVLYGPELSGGGVLPGPFAYFLLAVPLIKGIDWRLIAYWDIALATLGGIICFWLVRRLFGTIAAIFTFGLYLSSHHVITVIKQLVTSSFVLPFHVFCLLGLIYVFSQEGAWRRKVWYATCLTCALAVQLQMTAIYCAIAAGFLQLMARKLRILRLPKKDWWFGVAIFALPFTPFLAWLVAAHVGLAAEPRAMELAGGFVSARIPVLVRSIEMIQFQGDSTLLRDLFDLQFDRSYLCSYLLGSLAVLLAATALIRPKKLRALFRQILRGTHPRHRAMRVAWVICFVLAAIGLPWIIKHLGPSRYLVSFEIILFIASSALFARLLRIWKNLGLALLTVTVIVACAMRWDPFRWMNPVTCLPAGLLLLGFLFMRKGSVRLKESTVTLVFTLAILTGAYFNQAHHLAKPRDWDREKGREPAAVDLADALSYIYQQSGWSYDEARRRIFRLWIKHSTDLAIVYKSVESYPRDAKLHGSDGYFIFPHPPDPNIHDWKAWLISNRIPAELKSGLKNGLLKIGEPRLFSKVAVIPYFVPDPYALPQYFHNVGFSYDREPEEKFLTGLTDPSGSVELKKDDYLFYWNPCSSDICRSGMRVTILRRTDDTIEASVNVFGNSLSKSSPWYSPAWTERFLSPTISVTCGGISDTQVLATSVGYHTVTYQSDTFLAPFERKLRFKCKGKLTGVAASFNKGLAHALEDRHNRAFTVPGVSKISRSL